MTILWLSCFMADDFSGYFGDVQIHPLISIDFFWISLEFDLNYVIFNGGWFIR